jgi:hypothetical protein
LPVAIRPNVARPWCNGSRLYPNWWGRLSNQNLSRNGLRRNGAGCHRPCDFSCRSRDRGFRDAASESQQCQQTKRHSHIIPPP